MEILLRSQMAARYCSSFLLLLIVSSSLIVFFFQEKVFPSDKLSVLSVLSVLLFTKNWDLWQQMEGFPSFILTSEQKTFCSFNNIDRNVFSRWTLKKKAEHYQSLIVPRHDRFGLVSAVSLLKVRYF